MTTEVDPQALALKALQLLGRWKRFSQTLKPYEPPCACCPELAPQTPEDLEYSLVCHLSERHYGNETVRALLVEGAAYVQGTTGSVVQLLQNVARRSLVSPVDVQGMIVDDIEAALDVAEANQS